MSFDLDVTVGGMCLLVRDMVNHKLHVLLPEIPAGGHAHVAKLLYLKKYTTIGAADDEKEELDLNGKIFDLSGLSCSNPLDLNLYPQVFDFANASPPRTVNRSLLTGALQANVRARITVTGGDPVRYSPGGFWRFDGGAPRRVATSIKWRLADIPDDELVVNLGGGTSRTLEPLDEGSGRKIRLFLLHLPEEEIPVTVPMDLSGPRNPPPGAGDEAAHFPFYYRLLEPGKPEQRLTFLNDGGEAPSGTGKGSELTCMVSTAKPGV